MELHQWHQRGAAGCVQPFLSECEATATQAQRLRALARLAARASAECIAKPDDTPTVRAALSRDSLIFEDDGGNSVSVRLLFAEVAYAADHRGSERFVVALAPAREPFAEASQRSPRAVWLLVIESGEAGLRRQLRGLGERGALRGDLREALAVTAKPFARGSSATVHEAYALREPISVNTTEGDLAAKVVPLAEDREEHTASKVLAEVAFLLLAGHPNIARFRGIFFGSRAGEEEEERSRGAVPDPLCRSCLVILTDLCPRGDLHQRVRRHGAYPETKALRLASHLLSALVHLHGLGIVHRDVKSANVLLGPNGHVLTDFGTAAWLTDAEAMRRRFGTPGYTAPEVLSDLSYDGKVDIFGTGVVLYYSLYAMTPFASGHQVDIQVVIQNTVECDVRCPLHREVNAQMTQFIQILLKKDPEDRPSARSAMDIARLLFWAPTDRVATAPNAAASRISRVAAAHPEEAPPVPQKKGTGSANEVAASRGASAAPVRGGPQAQALLERVPRPPPLASPAPRRPAPRGFRPSEHAGRPYSQSNHTATPEAEANQGSLSAGGALGSSSKSAAPSSSAGVGDSSSRSPSVSQSADRSGSSARGHPAGLIASITPSFLHRGSQQPSL